MVDKTIEPILYRTGSADRALALGLVALMVCSLPAVWWASGPFLWPWGWGATVLIAAGAALTFGWWRNASGGVLWVPKNESLEFRRGRRVRVVELAALTRVEVRPARVMTRLEEGDEHFRLSHRLVGVEDLLDILRLRRPDLFPSPESWETLRVSPVGVMATAFLAVLSLAAGLIVAQWVPPLEWTFFGGTVLVVGRALFFLPRSFVVAPGSLTEVYWLRRGKRTGFKGCQVSSYVAGGAVFCRLRLGFASRSVILDEGFLLDSLRPRTEWIVGQLNLGHPN